MLSYVGERETNGHNRSPFIDSVNRFVHVPLGSPYCASTVGYCLGFSGVTDPTPTGLAIRYRTSHSVTVQDVLNGKYSIQPGDIVVWQKGKTIKGHCGLAIRQTARDKVQCVEANTSCAGSGDDREGDGICIRTRRLLRYCYFGPKYITRPRYPPAGDSARIGWIAKELRNRPFTG